MNRDTIIGFILIAAILVGYSIWMTPSKEELADRQRKIDSVNFVRQQQRLIDSLRIATLPLNNALAEPAEEVVDLVDTSDTDMNELRKRFGVFAGSTIGTDTTYTIENDLIELKFGAKGGFIHEAVLKNFQTFDSLPLIMFDPNTALFNLSFFVQNRTVSTGDFYFKPYLNGEPFTNQQPDFSDRDSLVFSMRLFADMADGAFDESRYIEFEYVLRKDQYMIDFNLNLEGMDKIIAFNTSFLNLDFAVDQLRQEKSVDQWNGSTIYFKYLKDEVDYLSETKDDEESIKTRLQWISFKQRFFSIALIAKEHFDNAELKTITKTDVNNPRYLKSVSSSIGLPFTLQSSQTIPLSLYIGPNNFKELRQYDLDMERQIPLGWGFFLLAWINIYIVIPVFGFLGSYGWNYGIVILVLTLLLKLLLFPIAYKTYHSSAKMRVLKPEIDEISAKFPKSEDAMKKQQAVMQLYKRAGANPMSGCVPMLLQMPILIAMFRFFPSSIELRQQPFLWAEDLSSYDSVMSLPFNIPFYGEHVSLFTLLMTISTIIYTYLNNQMMGAQTTQLPGMKTMMYLMPIMFLGLFNNYASGLSYYYLLANLITFGQMYIFRLAINEDKLRAQIEINKKKPIKKSGFQKRLEEAAKKRGYKA
ncbi:MAG: membrane protein insertase YidC [Bacteroidales bacterium]|nr:membrane protein insertase YidC [Bacteroidales bacterium]